MKKIALAITLSSFALNAQAEQTCKFFKVVGQRTISKVCAEQKLPNVLENPALVDNIGISWPIAPGLNSESRADKICKMMGFKESVDASISDCSYEQATLNLRGNYAVQGMFFLSKCFSRIECISKASR